MNEYLFSCNPQHPDLITVGYSDSLYLFISLPTYDSVSNTYLLLIIALSPSMFINIQHLLTLTISKRWEAATAVPLERSELNLYLV